jgi:DHA2 family lincomycin resistance protein-like MFS transporter
MLPLLMTTILTLVPMERRGVVMGNVSIAISVAPAIGPTVSGIILNFGSWRFMFVVVLPIAVAALIYGSRRLVNVGGQAQQRLDLISVILSVPAFGGVVYGLSQLGGPATGSAVPVAALAIGAVCLLTFGWRQLRLARSGGTAPRRSLDADPSRGRSPLLDLSAFRFPMFSLSVALLCIAMMGLFGVVILLPIYLQSVHGIGALATGLMLLPGGLLMGLLGPTVGRLFDKYGPRGLTVTGSVILTFIMWRFSTITPTTPIWLLVIMHVTLSLALAMMFTPAFTTGLNPLPPHLYSHGSAILTTLQQVAGAAGTALLVAVMASRTATLVGQGVAPVLAQNGGINTAFGLGALICAGSVACAVFMRNPRPATTESPAAEAVDARQ